MPVRVIVTKGTEADCSQAIALAKGVDMSALFGDKAYDTDEIIAYCRENGIEAVIPPKKNRKEKREYDAYLYKLRHLVENAIMRMKEWRGIATRYAKRAESFLAAVHIRCIALWLAVL